MDNRIHSTNLNPVDSATGYLILIYWKVIYPLDSAFQRLRNRRLYFIFIYCGQNLTAWHRLSVRLLQAAITVIVSHVNENFIGRARRVQIKSVVLLLHVAGLLRNKHTKQTFSIRLKRLTSAGVSISCESCFTCACVRSHSITTHRIDVTAVRVGRAFVDIYIQTWCCHYKNFKASSLHTYVIFIIFALEFWSSLQGNIFEKPIHTYTLNTLQQKNYVFTQKKLYLLLYRTDIFLEIHQVYFSF